MVSANVVLYWLVITAVIAGESLLILWAATSTRPRLVRALVVWITIVMLMAIDAHVPALMFVMTAVVGWAIVALAQRWPLRLSDGWRITLADLFAVLLVVATVATLWRYTRAPWQAVVYFPLLAMPLAPVIAFAHLMVAEPRRGWMAIATVVALLLSATSLVRWDTAQALGIGYLIRLHHSPGRPLDRLGLHLTLIGLLLVCGIAMTASAMKLWKRPPAGRRRLGYAVVIALAAGISILLVARFGDEWRLTSAAQLQTELQIAALAVMPPAALAALVALATWIARLPCQGAAANRSRLARAVAACVVALILVPSAWLYWQMLWPTPFPPPPPGPTNYYRIVQIAKQRPSGRGFNGFDPHTAALAEELVTLLQEPNHLPTQALEDEVNFYENRSKILDRSDLIALQDLLTTASGDAYARGQYDQAADYIIAEFRVWEMCIRGGAALEYDGASPSSLAKHRNWVSIQKAQAIVAILERSLAEQEPLDVIYQRARVAHERRFGWQGRLRNVLVRFGPPPDDSSWHQYFYLPYQANLRSIQWLYAIRLFQEERRRLPKSLAELSPEFLPVPPDDPLTDHPLVYIPNTIDYKLYSVGPNGIDDGGKGDDVDLSWSEYQQ